MRNRLLSTLSLAMIAAAPLAGCGPTKVRLYEGPELPDEQLTFLVTNPHLDVNVDRKHTVRAELHELALPEGHHAVEVRCLYGDDVPFHPANGGPPTTGLGADQPRESPPIALVMDGEPGHRYKPRVHFTKNESGLPGCKVRMFDVTTESGGAKNHLY